MSKKSDFIRSEQSRDKHPERDWVGSASSEELRGAAKANLEDLFLKLTGRQIREEG